MFDDFARSLFGDFPEFDGLTRNEAARALSRAYLRIIQLRTNGQNASDNEDVPEILSFLRRLANVMIFHVVFDQNRDDLQKRAGAFVAAEAFALLADYVALFQPESGSADDQIHHNERCPRIEAALLYLLAEYDACAAGVLTLPESVATDDANLNVASAAWCYRNLERLCKMQLSPPLPTTHNLQFLNADELGPADLERDTIGRLYIELGIAAAEVAEWLSDGTLTLDSPISRLDSLIRVLGSTRTDGVEPRRGNDYARIYHLSFLLRMCIPLLGDRSLVHTVPSPPDVDDALYRSYLKSRALGTEHSPGRPVLWPSAREYVVNCILGETKHAVVSMPTGSGKSFVGELAISQAVGSGWALYLAPTNALAEQIRGDLRRGLASLDTTIMAFIGDQEYSIFATEAVHTMPNGSVAVMTPEKCALGLRLSPEAFKTCRLVIFDECHLIGDTGSSRGPVAELVVSQLILRAPDCRFLLMSAIIQNPEDLASWIQEATGSSANPVSVRWRPTRTLRSALGVDDASFQTAATTAQAALNELPARRKNLAFTARCAIAAGLQGAWQSSMEVDYAIAAIDCDADLAVNRKMTGSGKWDYNYNTDSWVNGTAVNLAECLAGKNIQTLVFTPASRHYPFSNGKKVTLSEETLSHLPPMPDLINVCQILSECELGCESEVAVLLRRGIAVHTSLMLETEKIASETAFKNRSAPVMFATGTLAQGLNLPALAVVIAGTRIGDPRGQDAEVVEQRKFSQLLNAAGRAGRAGFANQGIVITIPDEVIGFRSLKDVLKVRQKLDFLQKSDDAVAVGSGLDSFVDELCKNALGSELTTTDLELQVTALLAGGDGNQLEPASVLRASYAAYRRRHEGLADISDANVQHLIDVKNAFIEKTGAPNWLTIAAQRAGLDFFVMFAITQAWAIVRAELPADCTEWTVNQWREEFLSVMSRIPPILIRRHLTDAHLGRASKEFKDMFKKQELFLFERENTWTPPAAWLTAWDTIKEPLELWMAGGSIAEIAGQLFGMPTHEVTSERTQGKPIPSALGMVFETWSSLALFAGGFLAVAEQILEGKVPLSLACLPMCIKYGCDSAGVLAWFRFGVRLRRPSRILADAFPPPNLETDEALKDWVRKRRRQWLNGSADVGKELSDHYRKELTALRAFITAN